MNGKMTRRGWLTGLVAVFGGWLSKAFGREHAASAVKAESVDTTLICTHRRDATGSSRVTYQRLKGKLLIEVNPDDGEFLISVLDRQGRVVEQSRQHLSCLSVCPELPVETPRREYCATHWKDPVVCTATTFVYDSVTKRLEDRSNV